jgi:hypothetical protein
VPRRRRRVDDTWCAEPRLSGPAGCGAPADADRAGDHRDQHGDSTLALSPERPTPFEQSVIDLLLDHPRWSRLRRGAPVVLITRSGTPARRGQRSGDRVVAAELGIGEASGSGPPQRVSRGVPARVRAPRTNRRPPVSPDRDRAGCVGRRPQPGCRTRKISRSKFVAVRSISWPVESRPAAATMSSGPSTRGPSAVGPSAQTRRASGSIRTWPARSTVARPAPGPAEQRSTARTLATHSRGSKGWTK